MISVTRKYSFSASHRLHVGSFTEEQNDTMFGKCNNPFGHGHNYEIEVTARGPVDADSGLAFDTRKLDTLVAEKVIAVFHLKNMNTDVAVFGETVPTTENVGLEIRRRLRDAWNSAFPDGWPKLEKLRIHETDRNIFEVSNEQA